MNRLFIKNMVCPRCIIAVGQIMRDCEVAVSHIKLGEVELAEQPDASTLACIGRKLEKLGFVLLEDPKALLVEQIRLAVMEWVNIKGNHPKLSAFLQDKLLKDYSTLSKLFSEAKGMTIERYSIRLRVERIKEELYYGEKTISELSYEWGYSSPAHLSTQFKQVTGLSPKQFQQTGRDTAAPYRQPIDEL